MSDLEIITLDQLMLEIDPHLEVSLRIGRELGSVAISKTEMVYCGVEGIDLETIKHTDDLPARSQTYGLTWNQLVDEAESYDNYPSDITQNPICYANKAADVPAVMVYASNKLSVDKMTPTLWVPRSGDSISAAARAIIFFR